MSVRVRNPFLIHFKYPLFRLKLCFKVVLFHYFHCFLPNTHNIRNELVIVERFWEIIMYFLRLRYRFCRYYCYFGKQVHCISWNLIILLPFFVIHQRIKVFCIYIVIYISICIGYTWIFRWESPLTINYEFVARDY